MVKLIVKANLALAVSVALAGCASGEREFHAGYDFRWFTPKLRVYFDTGSDDDGEVDIFQDGSVSPSIDFVNAYFPMSFTKTQEKIEEEYQKKIDKVTAAKFTNESLRDEIIDKFENRRDMELQNAAEGAYAERSFRIGPSLGLGIGSPAQESPDGTEEASNAPVVMFSGGIEAMLPIASSSSAVGVEFGYAYGRSADENFADADDGAVYIGINVSFGNDKTK